MTHSIRPIYTCVPAALIRGASIVTSSERGRVLGVILGAGPPAPPDTIYVVILLILACGLATFVRNIAS